MRIERRGRREKGTVSTVISVKIISRGTLLDRGSVQNVPEHRSGPRCSERSGYLVSLGPGHGTRSYATLGTVPSTLGTEPALKLGL